MAQTSKNTPEQVVLLKKRIEYLREVLDMTTEEVASRVGISNELYVEYESGDEDIPISVIYTLATVFGVDPTEILTGDTPKVEEFSVTRKGTGIKVKRYEGYDFESDDDLEGETPDEHDLGNKIGEKLDKPHKKIIVKGVFNKNTKKIENKTEIEATDKISTDVKQETDGKRFAEIECED